MSTHKAVSAADSHYKTLVVDPPWKYDRQPLKVKPPYQLMALEEIKKFPIQDFAAADAHMYLWVPSAFVADGVDILNTWGFDFKTTIVWVKHQVGIGGWWRNAHELILFGVRGDLPPLRRDLRTWFMADRRQHSRKPDEFYRLAEQMSPGPRIDIFSREKRDGWEQWGNQTDHFDAVKERREDGEDTGAVAAAVVEFKEDATMQQTNDGWETAEDISKRLSVSVPTVRRQTKDGTIPAHRLGKRLIRYRWSEVEAALRGTKNTN